MLTLSHFLCWWRRKQRGDFQKTKSTLSHLIAPCSRGLTPQCCRFRTTETATETELTGKCGRVVQMKVLIHSHVSLLKPNFAASSWFHWKQSPLQKQQIHKKWRSVRSYTWGQIPLCSKAGVSRRWFLLVLEAPVSSRSKWAILACLIGNDENFKSWGGEKSQDFQFWAFSVYLPLNSLAFPKIKINTHVFVTPRKTWDFRSLSAFAGRENQRGYKSNVD